MKGKWPLVLLGVLSALSLATMPGCVFHFDSFGHPIGNLQCSNPHVTVLPGQSNCKIDPAGNLECELMNPCPLCQTCPLDGEWLGLSFNEVDDLKTGPCPFVLPGSVNGITIKSDTTAGFMKRFLVADLTVQPKVDLPICYSYVDGHPIPPAVGIGTLFVTTAAQGGFKVGVQIPFDAPDGQVSVTVGSNVCLATNKTTCTQLVPGGTQVLLKVVKFPANTTKVFDWNNVTCDISRTPTSCTFTVTKDTSVVPAFI